MSRIVTARKVGMMTAQGVNNNNIGKPNVKNKGLGKGLSALFPQEDTNTAPISDMNIKTTLLEPRKDQPTQYTGYCIVAT